MGLAVRLAGLAVRLAVRLAARVRAHVEASDALWTICGSTKPWAARWCTRVLLVTCMVATLVPPPSFGPPALRWLLQAAIMAGAYTMAAINQGQIIASSRSLAQGLSTVSLVSFTASTLLTAVQPLVVMVNSLAHFPAAAPLVAGLLMPPLRFHAAFVAGMAITWSILAAKHVMYVFSGKKALPDNLMEFFTSLISLAFDNFIFYLTLCALDKLHDVNAHLAKIGAVGPWRRSIVLESAARQYELTADQVAALGSLDTLGLPLASNSVRQRIKLVTDSFLVYRAVEKMTTLELGTLGSLAMQFISASARIVVLGMAGHRLYLESRKTESVLGTVSTIGWPEREKLLVERLLRNSRRGVTWSMGGLADLNHGYLLSVVGSTVTYMVVLMQYKDPVGADAAPPPPPL